MTASLHFSREPSSSFVSLQGPHQGTKASHLVSRDSITEDLSAKPGRLRHNRVFLHSFKSNRIKQLQSLSFTFPLSNSHTMKGSLLFFTPLLDSLHLSSRLSPEDEPKGQKWSFFLSHRLRTWRRNRAKHTRQVCKSVQFTSRTPSCSSPFTALATG